MLIAIRRYIPVPKYIKYTVFNEIQKHRELSQIYSFVPNIIAISMESETKTSDNS